MAFNIEVGREAEENSTSEAGGRLNDCAVDAINQKDWVVLPERGGAVGGDWGADDDWPTQQSFPQAQ
jgi:hypothetical protein